MMALARMGVRLEPVSAGCFMATGLAPLGEDSASSPGQLATIFNCSIPFIQRIYLINHCHQRDTPPGQTAVVYEGK